MIPNGKKIITIRTTRFITIRTTGFFDFIKQEQDSIEQGTGFHKTRNKTDEENLCSIHVRPNNTTTSDIPARNYKLVVHSIATTDHRSTPKHNVKPSPPTTDVQLQ